MILLHVADGRSQGSAGSEKSCASGRSLSGSIVVQGEGCRRGCGRNILEFAYTAAGVEHGDE